MGIGAAIGTTIPAVAQGLVAAVGFQSAGVAAGSIAAGLQGSAVISGSGFAIMQSLGATAALVSAPVLGAALGVGVIGGLIYNLIPESTTNSEEKRESFTGNDPVVS